MTSQPASTFTARDGRTYTLAMANSRKVIREHDELQIDEIVHEYWITEDDDSMRCYVAQDGIRHTLD